MTDKKDLLDDDILQNLRRVYGSAAQEPVPERFSKLLEQLRNQDGASASEDRTAK